MKIVWGGFVYKDCLGCSNAEEGPCKRFTGQESRQFSRVGGCSMDSRKAKDSIREHRMNPMKASKRQHKGLYNLA